MLLFQSVLLGLAVNLPSYFLLLTTGGKQGHILAVLAFLLPILRYIAVRKLFKKGFPKEISIQGINATILGFGLGSLINGIVLTGVGHIPVGSIIAIGSAFLMYEGWRGYKGYKFFIPIRD